MDFKALLITIGQKLFSYMEIARISVIFMGLPFAMAGAAYALSITHVSISIFQAIAGVLAVFFVTGAVHITDDYFDRERDRSLWPNRQIPSRGTTPKGAIYMALITGCIGFVLVFLFYNVYCALILVIAAAWTTAYTGYLREKYGYMTLPFAIGLFPLGGYVAFSPSTLWIDPIPWLLYIMVFLWQSAHILAYSPPHGVKDGKTVVPVLVKRFSPENTLIMAGIFAGACMSMGILIFLLTNLGYIYLGITIGLGMLIILCSFNFSRNLTVQNCMKLVFFNSIYGWAVFLTMTLEYLIRYDIIFFYIVLVFGILMMASSPLFGGFGMPNIEISIEKY